MPDDFRSRIRNRVLGQEQPEQKTTSGFFAPVSGDATLEALKQPGAMFNKGMSQLTDNPLAGVLNIGQGIAGIPFLMATVPLAMGEDFLKTFDRTVGTVDKEGKPSGAGNFISQGLNGIFQTPAFLYDMGKKGVDLGLINSGIDPNKVDAKIKQGMIISRLMPQGATEEQFKETQEALDEAGKLGATLLGFEGIKLAKNKIAPKVDKVNVVPKEEVPQDVKQTLQIEAPKQESTFSQIQVDRTGRNKTVPTTKNTQAYTKMELLRDELSTKKDKLVSDRDILKKKAFDRTATSEQRIEAKNQLKIVTEELNDVSKRLPLIESELKSKRFEVESKDIPEQKLLTEGDRTIPTENVPSNINFSLPKERIVEIGKESGLKGLPVKRGINPKEFIVGDVAEVQKPTGIIERRTDKAGKEYYYNTETKKRTSKEEFEKLKLVEEKPVEDIKISEIKEEPIENKTVENIKKAQEIIGKEKFTEVATKLSEGKATVLKQVYTEELANKIVEEGKLPEKYIEKVETETKPNILKDVENAKIGDAVLINYGDGRKYEGTLTSKGKKNIKVETTSSMYGKQELTFPTEKIEAYIPKSKTKVETPKSKRKVEKPVDDIRSTKTYDMYRKLGKTDAEAVELIKIARQEGKNMQVIDPDIKAQKPAEINPTIERLRKEALGDKPEPTKSNKIENERRLERLNNQLFDAQRGAPEKFLENRSEINRLKREIRDEEIRQGIRPPLDKPEIMESKSSDFTEQKKFIQNQFDRLLSEIESIKPADRLGRDIEFKMGDFTARIMNPNAETLREFRKSASQSTNTPTLKNEGLNPKAKIDIDAVNQAKINIIKKSLGQNNFGFDVSMLQDYATIGRYYFKEGAVKFADWSQKMIKDLGEKIKPQLLRIWSEIKKFGEDLGKIAVDKISDFVESKYNPARPLKIVDLNLLNKSPKTPITEKANAFSEGMKNIAQKDRDTIKREYREQIKEKEKFSNKFTNLLKEAGDIKKVAKTVLEPITTSAEKVSKDVFRRFRLFGQSYQVNLLKRHGLVGDYFDAKKKSKITPDELADYNISLLNGWFDDAKVIAKKYGFDKQLNDVLKAKDDLAKELSVKTVENHFPRMVEDFDGFVKFLEEKFPDYYKDNFSRLITEKANKVGRELTIEEKANLINNALRGYNPGITLSDVGNMKKRVIQTLDGELAKFYHNPDASLLKYVNEMTELSEARKFFGKGYDVNESIGAYIQDLRDGKKLDLEGSRELMEIFKSRFNQKTITNKGITALRDIGVITKLGNPYSTMTQLKDLAYSMYFSPTRTPVELAKLIGSKITGKTPEWQIKELGIDPLKIAEELANPKKRAKLVQGFLDYSGFSKLDMIGKETLINTLWSKYQKQAKDLKLNTEFERRIERYFGKGEEKAKVLSDLRNGRKTDSTAFLLYNELVGAQPISLLEMPRGYLKGGNWRIAYFLKTFSIRQLDFALNETVRVMTDKSLPKEQRRQGAYNLMKLGTSLALTGATVDQVRSYLMNALTGKKNDQTFSDDMLDNLLSASLLSKYDYTKIRQTGISEAMGSKLLPPMDFISDPLFFDLPNVLDEKGKALKSTKHIPMIGKFLYEYLKDNRTTRTTRR